MPLSPDPSPLPGARRIVRFEVAPQTLIAVLLIVAAAWMLVQLAAVLLVLVGALMIVGALNPLVSALEERKFRRGNAIGLVFGVAFALTAFGLFLTVPSLVAQVRALIEHEADIRETIAGHLAAAYSVGPGTALVVFVLLVVYEEFESRVLVPLVYGRALRLPSSVVFFSLLVGGALGGIVGALLALPIASAVVMLLDELRVDIPGETEQPEDVAVRQEDRREEREYEARTEDAPAVEASAVAVQIARERKEAEDVAADENKPKA